MTFGGSPARRAISRSVHEVCLRVTDAPDGLSSMEAHLPP